MNINQHNYEDFFLLYIDGELSATDRQTVEQFAQANPGLGNELEMLLQMRLTDETVLFDGKEGLYKNEAAEISLNNYEEQFLLYVDNELGVVSKEKVETFVLQHPALQESFTLLKQTHLEPETIVFADKTLLYKKEAKERPIFYLGWQRIAVAAALIGFVVLVWMPFPSNKLSIQNTAKLDQKSNPALQKKTDVAASTNNNIATPLLKNNTENLVANQTGIASQKVNPASANTAVANKDNNATVLPAANNTDMVSGGVKREDIVSNPVETVEKNQLTQKLPTANASLTNTEMVKVNHTEEPDNTDQLAQQTVYKELDTDDEKKSLYVGSLEINKDKLRGFFRKAGSIFRSKSKTEDDKTDSRPSSNTRSLK